MAGFHNGFATILLLWCLVAVPANAQACASSVAGEACRDKLRDDSFVTAQNDAMNETADAVARVGARAAAQTNSLGTLVRNLEQGEREHRATMALLTAMASSGQVADAALTEKARVEEQLIRNSESILQRDFPEFSELVAPAPVDRRELQKLLGADEALVMFSRPGSESVFVWVVTRERAVWARVPFGDADLSKRILDLRRGVDPSAGCTTERPSTGSARGGPLGGEIFDLELAAGLYRDLLLPVEAEFASKHHIVLVPLGSLMSLPFAALPKRLVRGEASDATVLRATPWFGIEHALTVLPAVSSLRALRCPRQGADGGCIARRHASSQKPAFVGIGAPVLNGGGVYEPTCARGISVERDVVVDQTGLAGLPLLEGADEELLNLRKLFGPENSTLYTGAAATEQTVRSANLEAASVIVFSTHGLLAQEAKEVVGLPESALVLTPPTLQTPPRSAGPDDDGALTVTEASTLRLNADWVVLSACNTAQGGRVGDSALSGFARAFFYAGARALLVSQWPVDDRGTAELITRTLQRSQTIPDRAEALRQAMESLLHDTSSDRYAHPSIWAPFVLVGDAGTTT